MEKIVSSITRFKIPIYNLKKEYLKEFWQNEDESDFPGF